MFSAMLICHCEGVSDREIREAVRSGCTSVEAIARRCGAGSGCGGCVPAVEELIEAHTEAATVVCRRENLTVLQEPSHRQERPAHAW